MTVSARDVAAALRARLPGVPTKKLHKLLYYCQGHHLTHAEDPWQLADRDRPRGGSVRIEREWMRDYFRSAAANHEDGEVWFTKDAVARLVTGAQARRASGPVGPDTREAVQMRINEARARLTSA